MNRLRIERVLNAETVYYYDSVNSEIIYSTGNRFTAQIGNEVHEFTLPIPIKGRAFLKFRKGRRALRLDMANVVLNHDRSGLVVIYQAMLYYYDLIEKTIQKVDKLRQCRNVLYNGIAVTSRGIYLGEYGSNNDRLPVPVWCSRDGGQSWQIVHEFPERSIKHIHGVYADPYSDSLWISTGDFENECFLYSTDEDFSDMRQFGDGMQKWRPVSLVFEKDKILWGMDSQLETCYLQEFDRAAGTLSQHRDFPGPVWYTKQLVDGCTLLQTVVELGPGVRSRFAHLFASTDNRDWTELARFRKDRWPMRFFKFGVLSFADGPQTSDNFALFGEGLVGMDGKAVIASIAN